MKLNVLFLLLFLGVYCLHTFFSPHARQARETRINKNKLPAADEFSFMVLPSVIHGVGVFATRNISKGTKLMITPDEYTTRVMRQEDIPPAFTRYCTAIEDKVYRCPEHFNMMPLECYWNHSEHPNVHMRIDGYYALQDIQEGQELLFNYHELNEPEHMKESFYAK